MKLTMLIILIGMLHVSADTRAQFVTLHKKSTSLKEIFNEISRQTGYDFVWSAKAVKSSTKASVDANNKALHATLEEVLDGLPLMYELRNKTILIRENPKALTSPPSKESETYLIDVLDDIRGRVVDSLGKPLVGASIRIKGAKLAATTNQHGDFTLQGVEEAAVVQVSYIGYISREISASADLGVIVLKMAKSDLEEVMVNAGYYIVKDRERTGSISRVTGETIKNQPVSNPLAALIGRMPGVNIVQSTGVPGSGFSVEIRGRNSITGNTQPLYIVDGVPFSNEGMGDQETGFILGTFAATGNYQSGLSPMVGINPSDIESIEVLKDADATAIYGSRGANGVVLITTRKYRKNSKPYSIRYTQGFGEIASRYNLLNTEEYLQIRKEAYQNDGIAIPTTAHDVNGNWDPTRYTDWQEVLVGNTAVQNNLQVSVQGGSDLTSFVLSGSSFKETLVFPGDHANRKFTTRSVVSHRSTDNRFQASANVALSVDKNDFPGVDLNSKAITLAPNAPALYKADGSLNWENNTWDNPVALLEQNYRSKYDYLNASMNLSQELFRKLTLSVRGGINYGWMDESKTNPHTMYNPSYGFGPDNSGIRLSSTNRQSWIIEPQLNYQKVWDNGVRMSSLLGSTFQSSSDAFLSQHAGGFTSNTLIHDIKSASRHTILDSRKVEYRYSALYGRLNFDLHNRYFLNFTGRRDGSSRFGPGKQFANFGAVGAAWIFSDEEFAKSLQSFLSYGKLRGSYGLTGSDNIGDYKFLDTYSSSTIKYEGKIGLSPTSLFNPDFAWEANAKLEGSLELGFFKNRIEWNTSYYRNRSSNQLVGVPLPATTGFSSIHSNLNATVQNSGWEFELSTHNIRSERLKWSTLFTMTLPDNKLVSFPNLELSTYANQYVIGHPLNIQKRYNLLGVDSETGVWKYEDVNQDGKLNVADRTVISHLNPSFYGGLNNSLSFGDFQFNIFLQFVKQEGRNYRFTFSSMPGLATNYPTAILDRWQNPGDQTAIQRVSSGAYSPAVTANSNYYYGTGMISDASFIRLKNINMSYNIPSKWMYGLEGSLYMQGQNLWTWTSYEGADPESNATANASISPLKMWTFGIQLNF